MVAIRSLQVEPVAEVESCGGPIVTVIRLGLEAGLSVGLPTSTRHGDFDVKQGVFSHQYWQLVAW